MIETQVTRLMADYDAEKVSRERVDAEILKTLKELSDHIQNVDKEVTFAKGVAYVLSGGTAVVSFLSGHFK